MGKTLYLECYSGISGDMTVGMLLDLGADQALLQEQLKSLQMDGFQVEIKRVKKSGLDVCDFCVVLDDEYENHDHDNSYLYGHIHSHSETEHVYDYSKVGHMHNHAEAVHMCESAESVPEGEHMCGNTEAEHADGHVENVNHHTHRGLPEILDIIRRSRITDRAKKIASDIFFILAEAEAKAHGISIEQVHFHEVGAVDSIVDIAAVAICLENLDITEVIVPELYEGKGMIRCQHGIIPVPVPAVVNIAQQHEIALHLTDIEAELVTPTGAAIVAAVRTSAELPKRYQIRKIGMGAGKRDYGRVSLLRGMLIEPETADQADSGEDYEEKGLVSKDVIGKDGIYKLESNIDDCTGETMGYVMGQLFAAGARDVHYLPVYMKKNRPAYQINVICTEDKISKMENIIFRETTTIGIRRVQMQRTVMDREIFTVQTSLGDAQVKVCRHADMARVYPEYESVAAICTKTGFSYREAWEKIRQEAEEKLL